MSKVFAPPAPNGRMKKGSPEAVRYVLGQAIKRLGGYTGAAVAAQVTENSVRLWMKHGCLNTVSVENALRFADAAKEPIDHFLVNWP